MFKKLILGMFSLLIAVPTNTTVYRMIQFMETQN